MCMCVCVCVCTHGVCMCIVCMCVCMYFYYCCYYYLYLKADIKNTEPGHCFAKSHTEWGIEITLAKWRPRTGSWRIPPVLNVLLRQLLALRPPPMSLVCSAQP